MEQTLSEKRKITTGWKIVQQKTKKKKNGKKDRKKKKKCTVKTKILYNTLEIFSYTKKIMFPIPDCKQIPNKKFSNVQIWKAFWNKNIKHIELNLEYLWTIMWRL